MDELAARNKRDVGELSARELRRWLLDERLAVEHDGLLYPTWRAFEVGGAL